MGLAASQARLLTITSRKSDCEFQSMRYSHQKIALSRSMTDISNEYQNSLNKTKLVYDFYGNGDQTNPVTYGLLMTPSELNGYMPMLTTGSDGRVVLNSAYAAAARAAGIPQEGLGCLPSETMRNSFYDGLLGSNIITQNVADLCKSTGYSQDIGMGAVDLIAKQVETKSVEELLETLSDNVSINFAETGYLCSNGNGANISNASLTDIWNGNYVLYTVNACNTNHDGDLSSLYKMDELVQWSGWDTMFDSIDQALDTGDPIVAAAIRGAREKINYILYGKTDGSSSDSNFKSTHGNDDGCGETHSNDGYASTNVPTGQGWGNTILGSGLDRKQGNEDDGLKAAQTLINGFGAWEEDGGITGLGGEVPNAEGVAERLKNNASKYIGYYGFRVNLQMGSYYGDRDTGSGLAIDVSNILKTYLTYIYEALSPANSRYKIDDNKVNVEKLSAWGDTHSILDSRIITDGSSRSVKRSNFISDKCEIDMVVSSGMNTEGTLYSGHYDALFNQIASRGWTVNNNVNDKDYLKEMYQNGLMFLTTCGDDGHYYQGDYSIHSYVKEVTDEEAIAQAEAKYNTEKQKLNHKEQIIDLKMKNLDTEISALTTEYDTIKSVISKNIERGFKRYDA